MAIAGGGYFSGLSGFATITYGAGRALALDNSVNPTATLHMTGGTVELGVGSTLAGIVGSDGDESVRISKATHVGGDIDFGGGQDSFATAAVTLSRQAGLPIAGAVRGGAGYDTIALGTADATPQIIEHYDVDLSNFSGFERLRFDNGIALQSGQRFNSDLTIIGANGFTTVILSDDAKYVVTGSDLAAARLTIGSRSDVTIAPDTRVGVIGDTPDTDRGQGDDLLSVSLTNAGQVLGDVRLAAGDDHFDGSSGLVGGTVYGGAGNDVLIGGAAADRLDGGTGADVLNGGAGDDVLVGHAGSDRLDGGIGHDLAVFSVALTSATVTRVGNALTIMSAESTDTLTNIETLQFSDGVVELTSRDPLVDNLFYDQRYHDILAAGVDPAAHYHQSGWHEGRDPSAYFSTTGYEAVNGDVRAAGIDPLAHYDQFGWKEGRDPSANFDTTLYLLHNPDVKAAGIDPLVHYLQFGQTEGRQAYAAIGTHIMADGFDPDYYLLSNPDVAKAALASGGDADQFAFQHYETYGWKEGRNPNALFDDKGYLAAYADVAAAGVNPLDHYHEFGWKEGRDPSAAFDTAQYIAHYGDVAAAGIDPLVHYLDYGAYELRGTFSDAGFGHL